MVYLCICDQKIELVELVLCSEKTTDTPESVFAVVKACNLQRVGVLTSFYQFLSKPDYLKRAGISSKDEGSDAEILRKDTFHQVYIFILRTNNIAVKC